MEFKAKLEYTTKLLQDTITARQISQEVASTLQQQCFNQIGHVVTKCLTAVFDDPYTFKLEYTQKAGKTQVGFKFLRNGHEIDPMLAAGGGVIDIASFALRVAALLLSKPTPRMVLILDEPFRFVSAEYRDRVRLLIEKLATEMGIQFIIVTHMEELKCGAVLQVGK